MAWLRRFGSEPFFGPASILIPLIIDGRTAEDRLREMADWHFQRLLGTARACVGTSAAFLTGLLASQFKDELRVDPFWIAFAAAGAAMVAAFGLYTYSRVRRQNELYATCLLILRLLTYP
jgi:hypothetical protein